jgi:signal transduction histidine kinase
MGIGNSSVDWLGMTGVAIGNSLESVVGVTLLIRVADFRPTLERVHDGVAFLLIGVLGCTTISATIGVAAYYTFGYVDAASVWLTWLIWWLGDMGGALVLMPVLLMLVRGNPSWAEMARRSESWLAFTFLLAASLLAFFGPEIGLLGFAACVSPIPILVWVGARLGPRGAALASAATILIATIATASGSGPFVLGTTTEAMCLLWAYGMLVGVTAFTLAGVAEQRNHADRRYRTEVQKRLRAEKRQLLFSERQRLTREMHDGLGGQLVSLLSTVERGAVGPREIAESLRRVIDDIRIVIDSWDPHPTKLSTALDKLRARLEPLLWRNGISLKWSIDDGIGDGIFSPESVLRVFRIIQESVTNSLRHAAASCIEVRMIFGDEEKEHLPLSISDDGCGFSTRGTTGGRGLESMSSRAEELGAEIRIEHLDLGTRVDLSIPLSR